MMLLKILFIIILILFPLGEFLRFDIGNNIAVKPLDFLIFLTVSSWILVFRNKLKQYFNVKYLLFPLIGLIALLLNLSWLKPNEQLTAFLYLVRWVMYAGLAVVCISFPESFKKKIILFLFFDGLVIVFFGFLQYFFYNNLHNLYYLGWDPHMHRIFSTFLDPNFTGGFLVLYLIFTAGIIYEYMKKKQKTKQKKLIILGLGSILLSTLIALFLTFSRSSLLMFIPASILFLTLIQKKKLIALMLIDRKSTRLNSSH